MLRGASSISTHNPTPSSVQTVIGFTWVEPSATVSTMPSASSSISSTVSARLAAARRATPRRTAVVATAVPATSPARTAQRTRPVESESVIGFPRYTRGIRSPIRVTIS